MSVLSSSAGSEPTLAASRAVRRSWQQFFLGARSRILVWYVVLMALSIVASLLLTRQMLTSRSEQQISRFLRQEVENFHRLGPAPSGRLEDRFDAFLERNTFKANESVLTLIDGKLYRSGAKPPDLSGDWLQHLTLTRASESGKRTGPDGPSLYTVEPVGERGMLVVSYAMQGKLQELDETMTAALEVSLSVLALASVAAWVAAGRVLAPLRVLTETARTIRESDLTQRIPVAGADELSELTRTFNEMLDRLQIAFSGQRDFINDAGHELRTPITIIRGHLELMSDDPLERRETLALVTDELDRMSRFVDDLLLLVRAEQPDFLLVEDVDVTSLSEELYAKARALGHRRWLLEAVGAGAVAADRQRITQAVMNLAQNATQHTLPGQTIALGSAVEGGTVRFWVRDTGEGIAGAEQKRIFERFARAANTRRRSEGAGLGLAICKAIAEAHGGAVELQSRIGHGSTFTITLPH